MKVDRLTRVNELLRREIGGILFRVLDRSVIDLAAVTVTHVIANSNLRDARVLISVRGDEALHRRALNHLQSRHAAIQEEVAKTVILKYTPRLHFELDRSLESGDRILTLLSTLPTPDEHEAPPDPEDPETDEPDRPV